MRTINLGTVRPASLHEQMGSVLRGKGWIRRYTLSYEIQVDGVDTRFVRVLRKSGIERLGERITDLGGEETVFNVQVLDGRGRDVTFDFDVFAQDDDKGSPSEYVHRMALMLLTFTPSTH